MKRTTTTLSALAAGAALLLAGCGSDTSGAASQAPGTSQPAITSAPAAPSTEDSTTDQPTADASATGESTDESTTDESTTDESTTDESTTDESTTEESTSDDTSTADTSATTTVGDGGDLDATSVSWFDTYCSGVTPALEEVKNISTVAGGASSDPKATLKKLAPIFTTMGNAFTKTAKDLDGVPVPTFNGGDTLASSVLKAMNEFGPKFTEIGSALEKGDTSALSKMGKDIQGLQELGKFKVDAGTLSAIKEIPSCKPLFSMGG